MSDEKIEEILRDFKNIITFFLGAIGVETFYICADNYINNQIENGLPILPDSELYNCFSVIHFNFKKEG